MKKIVCVVSLLGLFMLLGSAMGADVSGKWAGKAGDASISFAFKMDGSKLTGSINNSLSPGEMAFEGGTVNGDDVTFYIVRNLNESTIKVMWKGKIAGDEIKFTRAIEGQASTANEVIAKRVK